MNTIDNLLAIRNRRMEEIEHNTPQSVMVNSYSRQKVSREYSDIVKESGVNTKVIWGDGGQQSNRMAEYDMNGIDYIHIPSQLLT